MSLGRLSFRQQRGHLTLDTIVKVHLTYFGIVLFSFAMKMKSSKLWSMSSEHVLIFISHSKNENQFSDAMPTYATNRFKLIKRTW